MAPATRVLPPFSERAALLSAHGAGFGQRLPRYEGAEIDGALPERRQALFPALVEHELALRIEANVVAGDLVLLGLGPGKLARIEVEPERLQDALQGARRIAHQILVMHHAVRHGFQ